MSSSIYSDTSADASPNLAAPNNVTIAMALNGRLLAKTISANGNEIAYDQAKYYKFFNRPVYSLQELFQYVQLLLARPRCCLIRGVCKDDTLVRQRRLLYGSDATIIEQDQNWFALDVDEFGECSGDLKRDARTVLLALGLDGAEAFAIPSAGYLRKPGIRIRLFLWNSVKVNCAALKKHFDHFGVVDTALFSAIQPIYIARPIFNGIADPCNKWWAWIIGERQWVDIKPIYQSYGNRHEEQYTKKQAERFFNSFLQKLFDKNDVADGERHRWLFGVAVACGKWIEQGLLDEEETLEELYLATAIWRGNRQRDLKTIQDGIERGRQSMEKEI